MCVYILWMKREKGAQAMCSVRHTLWEHRTHDPIIAVYYAWIDISPSYQRCTTSKDTRHVAFTFSIQSLSTQRCVFQKIYLDFMSVYYRRMFYLFYDFSHLLFHVYSNCLNSPQFHHSNLGYIDTTPFFFFFFNHTSVPTVHINREFIQKSFPPHFVHTFSLLF